MSDYVVLTKKEVAKITKALEAAQDAIVDSRTLLTEQFAQSENVAPRKAGRKPGPKPRAERVEDFANVQGNEIVHEQKVPHIGKRANGSLSARLEAKQTEAQ